ncbi:MAG: SDR family oxidoreductase [Candidatus Omnitrophica bacterium]|nr:SDR family oxidoreductase [Candidatus Omnitrophota bacterium]
MGYYLVTGGAGFIGSNITEHLVKLRKKVRVLDNFSTGLMDHLRPFRDKIDLMRGDIRSMRVASGAMEDVDYVFHTAANRAVLKSVEQPLETHEVNVTGTLNLLIAAVRAKVKRFVFTSSSAVYGNTKKFPSSEEDPMMPESPYGTSKVLGEEYCRLFSRSFGLDTVSLRYFNVYGPRQHPESRYSLVIPIFLDCLLQGIRPEIHWDGKQTRDFVYVEDVVEGNLKAIEGPRKNGEVYNISTGKAISILDVFKILAARLDKGHIQPRFAPKRPGDVRKTLADIKKAKRDLGYTARIGFEEGIQRSIDYYVKNLKHRKAHS